MRRESKYLFSTSHRSKQEENPQTPFPRPHALAAARKQVARRAMRELPGLQVKVLGGGRIAFEGSPKHINVYGEYNQ